MYFKLNILVLYEYIEDAAGDGNADDYVIDDIYIYIYILYIANYNMYAILERVNN